MKTASTLLLLASLEIDCNAPWLVFSATEGNNQVLKHSLEKYGQLEPVLVTKKENKWLLVHGIQRVQALSAMNRQIIAREVDDLPQHELALLRLACNKAYTLGEGVPVSLLLAAVRFFQSRVEAKTLEQVLPQAFGLSQKSKTWRRVVQWASIFPEDASWNRHLVEERMPLSGVEQISRFDSAERQTLEVLFQRHAWSTGGARQLLGLIWETSRREGESAADTLQRAGIHALEDASLSPKDAMARVLDALREVRNPVRTALEREFGEAARTLAAGSAWKLAPEQNFETGALHVSARLPSPEAARKAADKLKDMADSSAWQKASQVGSKEQRGGQ